MERKILKKEKIIIKNVHLTEDVSASATCPSCNSTIDIEYANKDAEEKFECKNCELSFSILIDDENSNKEIKNVEVMKEGKMNIMNIEDVIISIETDIHATCPSCQLEISEHDIDVEQKTKMDCNKCNLEFIIDPSSIRDYESQTFTEVVFFEKVNCLHKAYPSNRECGYCINCRVKEERNNRA